MAGRRRGYETVADMVRSLGLVVGVVAVLAIVVALAMPDPQPEPDIDYRVVAGQVRADAPYALVAPPELPEGWRASSARLREVDGSTVWSVGMVTDDGGFVGLEQTDAEPARVERAQLEGFEPDGESVVQGRAWQRWVESGRSPDRALSSESSTASGRSTVLVVGTVDYERLEDFAATLVQVPG